MRIIATDVEGPISKNDNAFELSRDFIPYGDVFFPIVSKIDDVWADNIVQPGYKAGDTLRLILPFLKVYGMSTGGMKEYSSNNILLVQGTKATLQYMVKTMPSFMISTSYRPYVSALCQLTGFPEENAYCTEVDIDKYSLSEKEERWLMKLKEEIVKIPMIEIPDGASKLEDFSEIDQRSITRLYEIFWEIIPSMSCGKMLKEVNPVGGWEKVNAAKDILERTGCSFSDLAYFADSITDVPLFQLIRKNNGVTISVNGNKYAVREAEVCVMSPHTLPSSIFVYAFNKGGREAVIELARKWSYKTIEDMAPKFYNDAVKIFPDNLPKVAIITDDNRAELADESNKFRKTVRGESIGKLG